jgi:hypothetical protein
MQTEIKKNQHPRREINHFEYQQLRSDPSSHWREQSYPHPVSIKKQTISKQPSALPEGSSFNEKKHTVKKFLSLPDSIILFRYR